MPPDHHDPLPGQGFLPARQWARIQAKHGGPIWPRGKYQSLEQLMGQEWGAMHGWESLKSGCGVGVFGESFPEGSMHRVGLPDFYHRGTPSCWRKTRDRGWAVLGGAEVPTQRQWRGLLSPLLVTQLVTWDIRKAVAYEWRPCMTRQRPPKTCPNKT